MMRRGSGILLHITSLPSDNGIGNVGPGARRFVDFLVRSGQTYWQVLPLNPPSPEEGNSPYSSASAFAGNTLLISPEDLIRDGWIDTAAAEPAPDFPKERIDFKLATQYKSKILDLAFKRFSRTEHTSEYENFCAENDSWLPDYALFVALREHFDGASWSAWPADIRDRQAQAVQHYYKALSEEVERQKFYQFLFYAQWSETKAYAHSQGVEIIGDMPIYMSYDSADVWAHPDIFKLDDNKRPLFVSGVPPDYFSKTGQLWGNPVYDWDRLSATGFEWWVRRMDHGLRFYDILRIDHFRGFVAYWEVAAGEKTAAKGRWVKAPAENLFQSIRRHNPNLPIIAENLGTITPDVKEFMERLGIPGMRVLLFAFGDGVAENPYAPHNHVKNCVVYTGTHDNNTVKGWYEQEATPEEKENLQRYLSHPISPDEVPAEFVRMAMMSVADVAIMPMQDVIGLGAESRMNTPSTTQNNWQWRLNPHALTSDLSEKMWQLAKIYSRLPQKNQ